MDDKKVERVFKRKFTTKNDGENVTLRENLPSKETDMDAEDVKNRDDFILFLKKLNADFNDWLQNEKSDNPIMWDSSRWAQKFTGDFLEAMSAWIEGHDYGKGKKALSWREIAELFDGARVYE